MKNDLLESMKSRTYDLYLKRVLDGGTTDKNFFEGHTVIGNYRLQQIPCEFAAYLQWVYEEAPYAGQYCEIGSCAGGSLRHIAELMPDGTYYSIDDMSYPETTYQQDNWKHLRNVYSFTINTRSPEFKDWLLIRRFNIVFLDACHMYDDVINDFMAVKDHVLDFVVFHDTCYMSEQCQVPAALEYLINSAFVTVHKHFENPTGKKLGITVCKVLRK